MFPAAFDGTVRQVRRALSKRVETQVDTSVWTHNIIASRQLRWAKPVDYTMITDMLKKRPIMYRILNLTSIFNAVSALMGNFLLVCQMNLWYLIMSIKLSSQEGNQNNSMSRITISALYKNFWHAVLREKQNTHFTWTSVTAQPGQIAPPWGALAQYRGGRVTDSLPPSMFDWPIEVFFFFWTLSFSS